MKRIIQIGARKIIVPGIFPLGYFPAYTTAFRANNSANYREHILLNKMSVLHNHELQKRLRLLNQDYRNITILYADYYNVFMRLVHNATHFGASSLFIIKTLLLVYDNWLLVEAAWLG